MFQGTVPLSLHWQLCLEWMLWWCLPQAERVTLHFPMGAMTIIECYRNCKATTEALFLPHPFCNRICSSLLRPNSHCCGLHCHLIRLVYIKMHGHMYLNILLQYTCTPYGLCANTLSCTRFKLNACNWHDLYTVSYVPYFAHVERTYSKLSAISDITHWRRLWEPV